MQSQEYGNFLVTRGFGQLMAAFLFCAALVLPASARTFTILHTFSNLDGADPQSPLVQGFDGNFYGVTSSGGERQEPQDGTVFRITPDGDLTTLHFFCLTDNCPDGAGANALALGPYGDLWGTTAGGGASLDGVVFRITPTGTLTTMHSFCTQPKCADGTGPVALLLGRDGAFYGTTSAGGNIHNAGTVFKIGLGGELHTLHNFCRLSGCTDGTQPSTGLIQGTDGNFYGTIAGAGTHNSGICANKGCGLVFKITPNGMLTTLYDFCSLPKCADGAVPQASLFQGTDGNFYGTTTMGGVDQPTNKNTTNFICNVAGCGTVFRLTPDSVFTTLYQFCKMANCLDGAYPAANLYQATDGNFYGTTVLGGTNPGGGTIFRITPTGTLTTIHNLSGNDTPVGSLIQGTDGKLYGTTSASGVFGIVYSLDVGLAPFVMTNPTAAGVGARVVILGNDLSGATAVSFNGTQTAITTSTETDIVTTVPAGATSGPITVTTPSGTLTSNVTFTVLP